MSYIGGGGGGGGGWSPPAPPASTPLHSYSIGVGSRGAGGATHPPNFTNCLHNELHCSIVIF